MKRYGIYLFLAVIILVFMFNLQNKKLSLLSIDYFDQVTANTQNNIYVSQSTGKIEDGSFDNPYNEINQAIEKAKPGDSIIIRGGTYDEKIVFKRSGTEKKWIKISNYQSEKVIIRGASMTVGNDSDMEGLINIKNKSYIAIEGITVTDFSSKNEKVPVGILVSGKSHDIKISKCTVSNIKNTNKNVEEANAHAIAVYGTSGNSSIYHLVIDQCSVYDNQLGLSEAIVLNGNVEKFLVSRNDVYSNDNIGIDFIGFEETASKHDYVRNGICDSNKVRHISSKNNPSYMAYSAAGIYVDGGRDLIIQNNEVSQADIGIEAASEHDQKETENIIIRNNIISNCKGIAGIAFGGYDDKRGSAKKIIITNNTLYNNIVQIVVQSHAQFSNNQIVNNIFYLGKTFEGDLSDIYFGSNLTSNPMFIDEKHLDFRLQKDSPAISNGEKNDYVGETDILGNPRLVDDKIDIGAYQSN